MDFGPVERVRERWNALPSETRFASGILGVCGFASIVLSVWYMSENLSAPFRVSTASLIAARTSFQSTSETRQIEASKLRDTDRDGLSDYAEINLHKTSPYLADTDSDGIPDAIELAQGMDPNCPKGQNCGGIANADLQPSVNSSSSYQDLLQGTQVKRAIEVGQAADAPTAAQEFILNAPDPSTISAAEARTLLGKSGLSPAGQLDGLVDEDVMKIYRATYVQVQTIRLNMNNATKGMATSTQ
ncbi:MAG: hypothetical protein WCK01_04600 [Candidatus Uhrbacteria bacterium]